MVVMAVLIEQRVDLRKKIPSSPNYFEDICVFSRDLISSSALYRGLG